jgi:O-antigen/teichoic acid export membrane protein
LYSIFSGLNNLLVVYTNKQKKDRVLFWNTLINALVLVLVTIPLGIWGIGGEGFMIGAIISSFIADLQMIVKTHPFAPVTFLNKSKLLIAKYRDFIRYQFPSNVIGVYSLQVPKQQFSYLFGNSSLGGYAMCEKILGIPSRLLGGPIGNIYFRQATTYVHEGKNLSAFTYKLIYRILAVSFIPVTILIIISEPLFTFILGDNWAIVGKIVNIMILPYVLGFCSCCLDFCLVVLNKQKINLYLTLINLLLTVIFIYMGYKFYGGFIGGIIGYAVSLVIYNLINLLIIFFYLKFHLMRIAVVLAIYMVSIVMVILFKAMMS